MSKIVYGVANAWVTDHFLVIPGKAYDADFPDVAEALERAPWAFTESVADVVATGVEQATAAPGERRSVKRG